MKSSFWVLCGVTLLCFGSVRCSRYFTDNDENFLDKTRDEERTSKEEDTEWELYKARNSWNDLTNELSRLSEMQKTEDECEEDCTGNKECKNKVCVCKSGYEGKDCNEITGCKDLGDKCTEIGKDCIFDADAPEKATCDCGDDLKYDPKANKCRQKCDDNCENEGTCEGKEGEKLCNCKPGTTGDLCGTITACEEGGKYENCKGAKGTCIFKAGKTNCECDETKTLYAILNYCEAPCKEGKTCDGNRDCNEDSFCVCKTGYEGDNCEVVTGCKELEEKCINIGKQCIFDASATGLATCDCDSPLKYDRKAEKCRAPCSQDKPCEGNRDCDDDNFCVCKNGYEGENCAVVTGCKELQEKCKEIEKECIFDASATGLATCNCDSPLKYDRKAEKCRAPCKEGKTCDGNRDCNDDNFCVCKNGYEGDDCDVVTGCNKLKEKCKEIGKDCIFDANAPGLATCKCEGILKYDLQKNECRVPDTTCNEEKPKCIPTGGACSQESDESVKCDCPAGITYDDDTGCNVTDEMCDEKYKECTETGGTCKVNADGKNIECICKAGITYNANTACNVPDDMCNTMQPKCKETEGSCIVDKNAVKCNCPTNFVYKENSGCAEDKCIAKCGVPYNKPNEMLKCINGPFGNVDCGCKNTSLKFDSRDKTCKIDYCKKKCGGSNKVKCGGDIFDEDEVKCECKDPNYDFVEKDNKKECKLNYCRKTCGTEGVTCKGDPYTSKTTSDCKCDDSEYGYNGKECQKLCSEDTDCENGGTCKATGKFKFCDCKDGTKGDTCDVVKDCQTGGHYEKCRDGKGECSYNVEEKKAICTCSSDQELYEAKGYCDVKCKEDSDCEGNRKCNSDEFCVCKDGYEGGDCEVITGCKDLKKKCDEIKTECIFDEKALGKATCKCEETKAYDRRANQCRPPCTKDKKCDGNRECNTDNFCQCKDGYEGEECNEVTGCKELKEICSKIGTECIFDKDAKNKATCQCKKGFTYDPKEKKCQPTFCYPKNPCPSTANCTMDESTGVGYCKCPENQYHHHINNKCEAFANKCLLRKTPCGENYKCVDGECECKYKIGKDEECKAQLCKPNTCVTGANCSEADGSCFCVEGKYFNGRKCEDANCILKDYKTNCSCPEDTVRKEGSNECVHKKDDEKCSVDCGYGICVKKGNKENCKCFKFAESSGGKCILRKSLCASGQLKDNSTKCKCEGIYKQADDGITCILRTCDDDDVKKICAAKGGECKMDWKKGYDCVCPAGYVKDKNANGKCTDPCSIEENIKDCTTKGKFCYNSYTTSEVMTKTCGCPPTAKEVKGVCSAKAEYSFLIKNIPVLKKQYQLKSGINKVLLNAHLIASLRQTYKKDIFDYGYLYDYNVQDDVVNCSVWINFKSAPSTTELEKIKVAAKKFSNLCDNCNEAVVWPPSLLLSDIGLKEAVPESLDFCKPEVKNRLCGKGASCVKDNKGNSKCFCQDGYKLIEYSLVMIGNDEVQRCEDIDECAAGTHTCTGNTVCRNTFGDYSCVCKEGFKKKEKPSDPETDKTDCVDMCTNSPCKNGKCVLKGKTFDCQCSPGAGGSLCDREDENYKSAKKSTVVVGAVLGTILAVGAIAVLYYIIKRKKRSGSEDFRPPARMDHAEMTERRHMRGVTNKAYE